MILIAVVGLATVWVLAQTASDNVLPQDNKTNDDVERSEESVQTVTFAAMGDMLAHDGVNLSARVSGGGYNYRQFFDNVKPLYGSADVVFCNPETLSAGSDYGISGYPQFNAPKEFARDLIAAGCDIFNYASNHVADKGQKALNASLDNWDKLKPMAINGANRSAEEQERVAYFEKNGIRFAFVAFADFSNMGLPEAYSINIYHDKALVERLMKRASANADVVLVSMHWGTEDSTELNDDQREAARRVADLGADVIIGTGPHVLQPVDMLTRSDGGKVLVWYSIGNMLSTQMWVNELTGGVARWTVTKQGDEITISDLAFEATFMSYSYSTTSDGGKRMVPGTLELKPLADAKSGTAKWNTTVAERTQFVHATLGNNIPVDVSP